MIGPREAVLTVLQDVLHGPGPATQGASPTANCITWETVQAVSPTGRHTILGTELPVTGLMVFPVGARVPVAWRGGVPIVIIGHRARRAQFHPAYRRTVSGIVEELFVANLDKTSNDVWYRNDQKAVSLKVAKLLSPHVPGAVKWGMDGLSFAVACGDGFYATFALSRTDANTVSDDNPGTASLLWLGKPSNIDVTLVTPSYGKNLAKRVIEWLGIYDVYTSYTAIEQVGGMWTWQGGLGINAVGWEGSAEAEGSASTSTPKAFDLTGLLANSITDWNGNALTAITLLDWYLDADRLLKFLYQVDWSYFVIGDSGSASGSVTWPNGMGTDTLSLSGTSTGLLGAMKQSDHSIIPETHLFIVVPQTASVEWATCPSTPTFTANQKTFGGRLLEHDKSLEPTYPSNLPQPHTSDWDPPNPPGSPIITDQYYGGGSTGGGGTYTQDSGTVAEERTTQDSSTLTGQMFDPTRLAAIMGPFVSDSGTLYTRTITMYGLGGAYYEETFSTTTGAIQRLWHYRVASAQIFTRRVKVTLPGNVTAYQDEPLFFLVLERYPVIAGTGYIDDIPQVWVGVVTKAGATVQTLRDWQYGLSSASMLLLSGNGHRVLWQLGTGWISPALQYVVTQISSGIEAAFTAAQMTAFLQKSARLYAPDFLWNRTVPEAFDLPGALPALTPDGSLADFGSLVPVASAPSPSVRMINDQEILDPVARYLAT